MSALARPMRPHWFHQPYTDNGDLDTNLAIQETGDVAHRSPVLPTDNPVDAAELEGIVDATLDAATARANSTAVTVGQNRKFANPESLWEVTVAGTTDAAQPSIAGKEIGDTVVDGTATFKRIL